MWHMYPRVFYAGWPPAEVLCAWCMNVRALLVCALLVCATMLGALLSKRAPGCASEHVDAIDAFVMSRVHVMPTFAYQL